MFQNNFQNPYAALMGYNPQSPQNMFSPQLEPAQDLAAYMAQVHQIISELYHTVESVEEREIIKNELAKIAQIC